MANTCTCNTDIEVTGDDISRPLVGGSDAIDCLSRYISRAESVLITTSDLLDLLRESDRELKINVLQSALDTAVGNIGLLRELLRECTITHPDDIKIQ